MNVLTDIGVLHDLFSLNGESNLLYSFYEVPRPLIPGSNPLHNSENIVHPYSRLDITLCPWICSLIQFQTHIPWIAHPSRILTINYALEFAFQYRPKAHHKFESGLYISWFEPRTPSVKRMGSNHSKSRRQTAWYFKHYLFNIVGSSYVLARWFGYSQLKPFQNHSHLCKLLHLIFKPCLVLYHPSS